ncbi:MAG: hypothetical protein R3240_04025 [Gammaproteobacteria bacterium]|nr:hypothetical protein [Gammaproteobacteria bacterium]
MLWFKNNSSKETVKSGDVITPTQLQVSYDEGICRNKLQMLLNQVEDKGGIEEFIQALSNKHALFNNALNESVIDELEYQAIEALLDTVFTARRKIPAVMSEIPLQTLKSQIKDLLYGEKELQDRISNFVALFETDNRKVKRAAWDFAAELLHFNAPEKYPHMSQWVWNASEISGAYREFLAGSDSLSEIPIGGTPGDFEATRVWLAEQLGQQGYYRDIHFLIDLLIAQAYADYVLGMSKGMGMFGSQFGAAETEPLEFLVKLLGIDPPRKKGLTRLKKAAIH